MSVSKSALIIANYRYESPELRQLAAPARDAESLARVLADPTIGGFEVRTLVNEPSHKVSLEIEGFCDNRKRDDLLLLYFSGHGIKDADGQLYFATIDTQLVHHNVRRATAVPAHFVNEVMSRSRSRHQILLLDCCYSGAFKEGMLAKDDRRVGAGQQLEGHGRVVLTASDALQYSFEGERVRGEGIRSVFTTTLVHGLETGEADLDRDGYYSLDEVYDYVHARVSDEQPEQRPMKMGYVEGKIFIGTNPRPAAAQLPQELLESLDDRRPWVRLGAAHELEKLLGAKNLGMVLAAQAALASLANEDDSQQVRAAAATLLAGQAVPQAAPPEQVVHELVTSASHAGEEEDLRGDGHIAAEKPEAAERERAKQERREQQRVEAESKVREQAEEARRKAEAQRVREETEAREKLQAGRDALEPEEAQIGAEAELKAGQEQTESKMPKWVTSRQRLWIAGSAVVALLIGMYLTLSRTKELPAPSGHSGAIPNVTSSRTKELPTLSGHSNAVPSVTLSGTDVFAVLYTKELLTLRGHVDGVQSVAWSPDGKRLATGSRDMTAKVWDASSGKELLTLSGHSGTVWSVAWSPDGKRLAMGSQDRTAKVWDAASGKELLTLRGHSDAVWSVDWSPDGRRLATGSRDMTAKVWDAASGKELLTLSHSDFVENVAWSPDGKRLATGCLDRTARIWDALSGKELLTLRSHVEDVFGVAWSPDGKRLAASSQDKTVKVWDAASGMELLTLSGHSGAVASVAWSPDGQRLATGSLDKTAKVWDAGSGKELLTLGGYSGAVESVAWSPDGKRLATSSLDKTVRVWDVGW